MVTLNEWVQFDAYEIYENEVQLYNNEVNVANLHGIDANEFLDGVQDV